MTEAFKIFKESLENISDEDFAKLLDEMENDSEGEGVTIAEFLETIQPNSLVCETIVENNLQSNISYHFDIENTEYSINKNLLEAA